MSTFRTVEDCMPFFVNRPPCARHMMETAQASSTDGRRRIDGTAKASFAFLHQHRTFHRVRRGSHSPRQDQAAHLPLWPSALRQQITSPSAGTLLLQVQSRTPVRSNPFEYPPKTRGLIRGPLTGTLRRLERYSRRRFPAGRAQ